MSRTKPSNDKQGAEQILGDSSSRCASRYHKLYLKKKMSIFLMVYANVQRIPAVGKHPLKTMYLHFTVLLCHLARLVM